VLLSVLRLPDIGLACDVSALGELSECFIGATYAFPITRQLTAETAAS